MSAFPLPAEETKAEGECTEETNLTKAIESEGHADDDGKKNAAADDDDEDDDDDEEDDEVDVQLGFVEPVEALKPGEKLLFADRDWHSWDGGLAGGAPQWLSPAHAPTRAASPDESQRTPLTVGARVVLVGLSRADLNGQLATVTEVETREDPERAGVRLDATGQVAAIRRTNLRTSPDAAAADLSCDVCGLPLAFILQIYAPRGGDDDDDGGGDGDGDGDADDDDGRGEAAAFHRAIYIFACRDGRCAARQTSTRRAVKAVRQQLARRNDVYPYEPDDEDDEDDAADEEGAEEAAVDARDARHAYFARRFEVVVEPEPAEVRTRWSALAPNEKHTEEYPPSSRVEPEPAERVGCAQ